jgi:hypothetical protein
MNEVITLQLATATPLQVRLKTFRIFCPDAVHLSAMASGDEVCGVCKKVLPKPSIPKCAHGVYSPFADKGHCSVCRPTFPGVATVREITTASSAVRINDADRILGRVRKQDSANFDRHQFENDRKDAEFGTVCEMFGYEPTGNDSPGFVIGVLRGTQAIRLRSDAPWWVVNSKVFKTFVDSQSNPSRARSVLFLFYRCGLDDEEISGRLRGVSGDAVKKYRQRLLRDGMARFGPEQRVA